MELGVGALGTVKASRKALERAERLRRIRLKLHDLASQRAFAARLGVSRSRLSNFELGSGVKEDVVKKIKDVTPGITSDYILYGDESGLTVEVLKKLRGQ